MQIPEILEGGGDTTSDLTMKRLQLIIYIKTVIICSKGFLKF